MPEIFRTGNYSKKSKSCPQRLRDLARYTGDADTNPILLSNRVLRYDMASSREAQIAAQLFDILGVAAIARFQESFSWDICNAGLFAFHLRDALDAERLS